jgi:YVTN family beta-propeller protein
VRAIAIMLLALLVVAGCDDDDTPDNGLVPPDETFSALVLPIFERSCATSGCHDAGAAASGLRLDSHANVMAGSEFGEAVIPFSPDRSLMMELLESGAEADPDHSTLLETDDLATLRTWVTEGCRDDDGEAAFADVTDKVYVTDQGADLISVVSVDDLVVMRLIGVEPFGGSLEAFPHFGSMAAGNDVWIATLLKAPGVWKFDARDSVVAKLETELAMPALSALTPGATKAYVTHFINPQAPGLGQVSAIDMASFQVTGTIPVLNTPHGIAMAADGREIYVANWGSDHITVIEATSDEVITHIPVSELVRGDIDSFEYRVIQIAVHPTERLIYASCTTSPSSPAGEIRVIDRSQGTVVDSLAVPAGSAAPWHLKVTADGSKLFVANRGQQLSGGDILQGSVSIYSTAPFAHLATVTDPSMALPHGLDFDSMGRYCFVSSENLNGGYTARHPVPGADPPGTLAVIDVATNTLVKVLEVEEFATGVFATQ